MMTHAEVLGALRVSRWSGAAAAEAAAAKVFVAHARALAAVQEPGDGRWHQLLDNATMWLETSCTAMFVVAMSRGVDAGWLDAATFNPVIAKAWAGLSRPDVIHDDGVVAGMCDGFGIHATPADYAGCKQLYSKGTPGLGSVLTAAVLMASRKQ
jgi:rhamnogalacturonyl hydrolase YesR